MLLNTANATGHIPVRSIKELFSYQKSAVKFILENRKAALWLECGFGKTICTLTAIAHLKKIKAVKKTLIIAPLRVAQSVWSQESAHWEHTSDLTFSLLHGPKKTVAGSADVHLINYEGLAWLEKQDVEYEMLVFDEISWLSNPASKRVKIIKKFPAQRRLGLTATPASNGLTKLFGQYLCLDGGKRLGKYVTHFRDQYCDSDYLGYTYTVKPEMKQPLYNAISSITYSPSAVVPRPFAMLQDITIALPLPLQGDYHRLEHDFFFEVADVEVFNVAALIGKLMQFCNGAVYNADGFHKVHDLKLKALEELIESLQGEPLFLCYSYHSDRDRIKQFFPFAVDMKDRPVTDIISGWENGEIQLLMGHPASCGHGLNLQHGGHHIAWFGIPFDLELYNQAIGRLQRTGQKNSVVVHRLLIEGSIEMKIAKVLESKTITQDELIAAICASPGDSSPPLMSLQEIH